jgi:hypothetical protein
VAIAMLARRGAPGCRTSRHRHADSDDPDRASNHTRSRLDRSGRSV